MRTETEIHKREVLAVWIKSCMSHVQDDYNKVTAAIKQTDMGKNAEKRDFLLTTSNATYITQGISNIRRSCIAIFLDKLPPQLAAELKKVTKQQKQIKKNSDRIDETVENVTVNHGDDECNPDDIGNVDDQSLLAENTNVNDNLKEEKQTTTNGGNDSNSGITSVTTNGGDDSNSGNDSSNGTPLVTINSRDESKS